MIFEVEIGGRRRAIAIEPAGSPGRYRVTLDGRTEIVEAVRSGELGLSLTGTSSPETRTGRDGSSWRHGASVALSVSPGGAPGEVLVYMQGRTVAAVLNGRRTGGGAGTSASDAGEIAIAAPMPGRVVRVLAAPGDEVAARQGIVVVEAMKMENELRAPRAGRVKEITVAAGASVEAGRVLAVIV